MRRSWWLGLVGVGVGTLVLMGISPAEADGAARSSVRSDGSGTWQPTTSMHQARAYALSVPLRAGRVLVIGGSSTPQTAEVYRVASQRWVRTGALVASSDEACAVRLADGRVLVAGGISMSRRPHALASAQLYDPKTRTWSATSSMNVARERPACVRLLDGRVLVAGGWRRPEATAQRSAELFDPSTGRWALTDPLLVRHGPASAVLLRGGDVLLAGGFGDQADPQSDAERYVVSTGTWRSAGNLSEPRFAPMFVLPGGRVIAIGGWGTRASARVDLYRPTRNDWVRGQPLPGPRADARLSASAGLPLVLGGYDRNRVRASVFQYQRDGGWVSRAALPRRIGGFTAVLLPDGRTLIAGGQTARPDPPPVRFAALFTPG
jgi:hypothetical protein